MNTWRLDTWLSYRPEDFLMFSEPVYWQMIQTHNALFWPAHILTMLAGLGVLVVLGNPARFARFRPGLLIAGPLAASWMLAGFGFLGLSYASINWAAEWLIPLFVFQGVLILLGRTDFGVGVPSGIAAVLGFGLLAYALAGYPLLAPLAGRPVAAAEVFGVAPDPTVIGTLGVLLIARSSLKRRTAPLSLALAISIVWCGVSWITLDTMDTWESWSPAVAALVALIGWSLPNAVSTGGTPKASRSGRAAGRPAAR